MDLPDIVPEIKEFFGKLLGPSAEELGLWGGEKVRFLRLKSSIKTFTRAQELLREAGFSEPKPVDLKTLVPLLEYCSLENDGSDLIEKWAGLLASASSIGLRTYSYPHILNQLSAIEAKIIDKLFDYCILNIPRGEWNMKGISLDELLSSFDISKDEFIIHIDNLYRFELCNPVGFRPITAGGGNPVSPKTSKTVSMSPLGADFVEACRGPKKQVIDL